MFFQLLNSNQNSIAASCILVFGIIQICVDSWSLLKLHEHEELIYFLSGNSISTKTDMSEMTYIQALSYFLRLKMSLDSDLLEILNKLQMSAILGIVAGIFQLFSSTGALMWKGSTVDIFWLVMNFIAGILLTVAVSYISINMVGDVPYHQVLLTVTAVNLFILIHIWIVNLIALVYVKYFGGQQSETTSTANIENNSDPQISSSNSQQRTGRDNTQANNNTTATTVNTAGTSYS